MEKLVVTFKGADLKDFNNYFWWVDTVVETYGQRNILAILVTIRGNVFTSNINSIQVVDKDIVD